MATYSFDAPLSRSVSVYDKLGGTLLGTVTLSPIGAVAEFDGGVLVAKYMDASGKVQGFRSIAPGPNYFTATIVLDDAEAVDTNAPFLEIASEVKRLSGLVSASNGQTILHLVDAGNAPDEDTRVFADNGTSVVPMTITALGFLTCSPITSEAINLRGQWQ